jgi:hypothetical protein
MNAFLIRDRREEGFPSHDLGPLTKRLALLEEAMSKLRSE